MRSMFLVFLFCACIVTTTWVINISSIKHHSYELPVSITDFHIQRTPAAFVSKPVSNEGHARHYFHSILLVTCFIIQYLWTLQVKALFPLSILMPLHFLSPIIQWRRTKYNKLQGVNFSHFLIYSCILPICRGEDAKSNTHVTIWAALSGESLSQAKKIPYLSLIFSQIIFCLSYIMSTRANKICWISMYFLWSTEYGKEIFPGISKVN